MTSEPSERICGKCNQNDMVRMLDNRVHWCSRCARMLGEPSDGPIPGREVVLTKCRCGDPRCTFLAEVQYTALERQAELSREPIRKGECILLKQAVHDYGGQVAIVESVTVNCIAGDGTRFVVDGENVIANSKQSIPGLPCTSCDALKAEIKILQAKITEMTRGIVLKGWHCMACGRFNGEEKEVHTHCRMCLVEKPNFQ